MISFIVRGINYLIKAHANAIQLHIHTIIVTYDVWDSESYQFNLGDLHACFCGVGFLKRLFISSTLDMLTDFYVHRYVDFDYFPFKNG